MVTYLCYYPHYSGLITSRVELDDTLFCLLLAMIKNPEDAPPGQEDLPREERFSSHLEELMDMIECGLEENRNLSEIDKKLHAELINADNASYALFDMLCGFWEDSGGDEEKDKDNSKKRPAKILRAFARQGFIAGEWEEGSHALALEGYTKAASKAIAKLEAAHTEEEADAFD